MKKNYDIRSPINAITRVIGVLLLFSYGAFGQKQSVNWFFGDNAAIDFKSGGPQYQSGSQMLQYEGVASISDQNGNLLFYTNGVDVWNAQHQVMQNGAGLKGHQSSTQSAIIVPQPRNDSIYFIFTCDYQAYPNGINYSVVNMKRQNGMGEVVQKNIFLLQPVAEKLTAVLHCNNRDIWVIGRAWNSANYYSWLVTPNGVETTPVISTTSNLISGNLLGTLGYMKASPDGKKLAAIHGAPLSFTEISEFNNQTGVVSGTIKIPATPVGIFATTPDEQLYLHYGLEFSPDSRLLYLSTREIADWGRTTGYTYEYYTICQFNLAAHDSTQIIQSRLLIDSSSKNPHYAMQIGPDNKIYVAEGNRFYLSSIESPNNIGAASNYRAQSVPLLAKCQLGLPSFIQSYFGDNIYDFEYQGNCSSSQVQFTISNTVGYSSLAWNFDDPSSGGQNISALNNPVHTFSKEGIYDVRLIVYRNNTPCAIPDTVQKTIWVGNVNSFLGADTTVCENELLQLQVNSFPGFSYTWSTNETSNSIQVDKPGMYWLKLTGGGCTYSDTIQIDYQSKPSFSLGRDTFYCAGESVSLKPDIAFTGVNYSWSTGAATETEVVSSPGNYWLQIVDRFGCNWQDTIVVAEKPLPLFNLGIDTVLCEGKELLLMPNVPNATFEWNDGSSSSMKRINYPGVYWLKANAGGCSFIDTIAVSYKPNPSISLGTDTTLCEGNTLLFDLTMPATQYLWQDNSTLATYEVQRPGVYFVHVTTDGCSSSDTISIVYNYKPLVSIGDDFLICQGQMVILEPLITSSLPYTLIWQDGTSTPVYAVDKQGLYVLGVSSSCGTVYDSVSVNIGTCQLFVPNAFTPNGDGLNDVFKILNTEGLTEFSLKVFNKWGQLVFQTTDRRKGWDGLFNGIRQPSGQFVWQLDYRELTDSRAKKLKGSFQLIR